MKKIFTIGTSNNSIEKFIRILKNYNIKTAIDVRSFPISKRFPHFSKEHISKALEESGIKYFYLGKQLGGFRKGGYEKYMETEEFIKGVEELEKLAEKGNTVFFCCEKLFFRCHRRFIAKVLAEKGWEVYHIVDFDKVYKERDLENKKQQSLKLS
ncbi:MAG: DUF488 domain-containing protein [Thermodesulfovibrio sp.]|nr:DUF488 domain-containing protein [Thermodesulfovibrio sp.]